MIMSENEEVYRIFGRICLSKLIQRLPFSLEHIFIVTRKPVAARPSIAETEGYTRMKHAEKELSQRIMEKSAKEAVAERNRAKAVTMSKAETLALDLNYSRLDKLLHAQLLKIAVCPHIVVSLEEVYTHTSVHQILKSGKDTNVALRYDIAILVPEVPYVPKKIQSLGICGQRTEKSDKTAFTFGRIADTEAKMDI